MIYFTQPGDDIESVAAKFTGDNNDDDFATQLAEINEDSFAVQRGGGDGFLAPSYAVWIPVDDETDADQVNDVIRRLDWIMPMQRYHLAQAQKDGLDIHHIIGAHKLVTEANRRTASPDIGLIGGAFAASTLEQAAEIKTLRLEKFNGILDNLKDNLKAMANAPTKALQNSASSEYKGNVRLLNEQFAYELQQFKLRGNFLLRKPRQVIREYEANGWDIDSIQIAEDADKAARYLNRLVSGLWVLDISNGVADTIQAYRENKDWVGVAAKESFEVATPFAVGNLGKYIFGLRFAPRGWVGVLATAAIEAGISLYIEHEIDKKSGIK